MDNRKLLVTGMFRSGTTLAARMLNTHPQIAFASDPFARVFKAFRNSVAVESMRAAKESPDAPLGDYYFYPEAQAIFRAAQGASFDASAKGLDMGALREAVASASHLFSPLIAPHLDLLGGDTFQSLFDSGYGVVEKAYGKPGTTVSGIKEVWVGEFASHFLRAFDGAKVIHIVRDPRGVCASNQASDGKYPLLFLIRQWRKLAVMAWRDQRAFPDRVHVVRFEDILRNPEQEIGEILSFVGVDFDERLLDPAEYVDGRNQPWKQNSTHFKGGQKFNLKSIDAWREKLSPRQVEMVETLCQLEMATFGYRESEAASLTLAPGHVTDPLRYETAELAEWIRPFSIQGCSAHMREMALEDFRLRTVAEGRPLDADEKQRLFLLEEYGDAVVQAGALNDKS